jgi:hypothetical protein
MTATLEPASPASKHEQADLHRVLFIVTGDPRSKRRPAEAIRIAAGVGVWKRALITIYLRDAAVLALSEHPEGLVDEEHYRRYFPLTRESGSPVYVQRGAPCLAHIGKTKFQFEEIDDTGLARLAARHDYVLRF